MPSHVKNMLRTQPSQVVRKLLKKAALPALSASMLLLSRVRLADRKSDQVPGHSAHAQQLFAQEAMLGRACLNKGPGCRRPSGMQSPFAAAGMRSLDLSASASIDQESVDR